jgi:hypothetical protein
MTAFGTLSCSSGGSDVAGIGGSGITSPSGYVSSGAITGFSSVLVNGTAFDTSSSSFDVDGNPDGVESDLAIGMRVKVYGAINADGVSGTAESIIYDDELQGPVSALTPPDTDGVHRAFDVFGTTVLVNSTTTNFDVSDEITIVEAFDFNSIADKDHVEISGYYDSTGMLVATRVELVSQAFNPGNDIIEIKGTITGLSNTTFSLDTFPGLTIDAASAALEDLPNDQLSDNIFVEVKGKCTDATCTTVVASLVEAESDDISSDDEVEIEGIITDYVDDSNFRVNGLPIDAATAVREPLSLTLENDTLVEVEGMFIDGVLIATDIKQEGGEIKIAATVFSVDTATNSFALEPVSVSGQTITVSIDSSTEIEDKINETIDNPTELINNLMPGDYLTVAGFDNGTGTVIATSVKLDTADKAILQGVVTGCSGDLTSGTITVLDIAFPYDDSTKFEDQNEGTIPDASAFCAAISLGSTLVKIIDDKPDGIPDGIADEVDIED